jgi:hypothetical protein
MNPSTHPEIWKTDHATEHLDNPRVDSAPQEHRCDTQTPPHDPAGPHVPGQGTFETFAGGAGI